jgi:hypothetical protein
MKTSELAGEGDGLAGPASAARNILVNEPPCPSLGGEDGGIGKDDSCGPDAVGIGDAASRSVAR